MFYFSTKVKILKIGLLCFKTLFFISTLVEKINSLIKTLLPYS